MRTSSAPSRAGLAPAAPTDVPSDDEVVRRVIGGDTASFEVLMRRHNRRIYRAVRSILRDEAESEDAMQAAYLSALSHLADFQGGAAFSTWLTRIAVNEALARLRRRVHLVPVEEVPEPTSLGGGAAPQDPELRAAARELVAVLERAVDRLPVDYRTLFVLREVEGLSTADAAASLGISEDLVKVRLHRARAALRSELLAMLGEDAPRAFEFEATRCDRVVRAVMALALGAATAGPLPHAD
jgi:RNA polymerase sigma-70 factor (ECF subfamily)